MTSRLGHTWPRGLYKLALIDDSLGQVPLQTGGDLKRRKVSVWNWEGEALDEGDHAADYLSEFLGHKVRLLRYAGTLDAIYLPPAPPFRRLSLEDEAMLQE